MFSLFDNENDTKTATLYILHFNFPFFLFISQSFNLFLLHFNFKDNFNLTDSVVSTIDINVEVQFWFGNRYQYQNEMTRQTWMEKCQKNKAKIKYVKREWGMNTKKKTEIQT